MPIIPSLVGVETERLHQIEGQSALQSDQCIQVYRETLSQQTETESKDKASKQEETTMLCTTLRV